MKWSIAAEALYSKIVERVPVSKRELVRKSLHRGAQQLALKIGSTEVTESDVIKGFFEVTPAQFHSQVKANLDGIGIDYTKYLSKGSNNSSEISIEQLLKDFEEMSLHLGVSFDRQKVEAALRAYSGQFMRSPLAMRMTTKSNEHRDLALRFLDLLNTLEPDPLTTALRCGFTKNDDGHPVFSLFNEIRERCGGFGYGVDIEANRGFSKIWMAPSVGSNTLDVLSSLSHLPSAAKNTIQHFKRFGLNSFGLMGFDFYHKTTNIYFMINRPAGKKINYKGLLTDLGLQTDSSELLKACQPAHVIYYSFDWNSATVLRVCFSIGCKDAKKVPVHFHPLLSECVNDPVFMHGQKMCVYSVVWTKNGNYFKFDNDYSGNQVTQLIEAADVGVTPKNLRR